MLRALFKPRLQLTVGDRTVSFHSLADFEFTLASRVEVPTAKLSDLVRLSAADLTREAESIRRVEKRFVAVLAESLEEPGSIDRLLRTLDRKLFTHDHEWRSMMSALIEKEGAEFDEFKKVALVKYMQYLAARQDVLKSLYAHKRTDEALEPEAAGETQSALRETVIFDVSEGAAGAGGRGDVGQAGSVFERIPRGETVRIQLRPRQELELLLSRNPFRLVPGASFYLVDGKGSDFLLGRGRNVVGRALDSEIVIDARYRDVSRTHCIIEPVDDRAVLITDLSSHGTFVPAGRAVPPA